MCFWRKALLVFMLLICPGCVAVRTWSESEALPLSRLERNITEFVLTIVPFYLQRTHVTPELVVIPKRLEWYQMARETPLLRIHRSFSIDSMLLRRNSQLMVRYKTLSSRMPTLWQYLWLKVKARELRAKFARLSFETRIGKLNEKKSRIGREVDIPMLMCLPLFCSTKKTNACSFEILVFWQLKSWSSRGERKK